MSIIKHVNDPFRQEKDPFAHGRQELPFLSEK